MFRSFAGGAGFMVSALSWFPLLIIPMGFYLALGAFGSLTAPLVQASLPSGALLSLTTEHVLILLAGFCLFAEMAKATNTGTKGITDHMLSAALAVFAIVAFFVFPVFGTACWLILAALQGIDLMAGIVVTITGARKDFGLGG